LIERKTYGAPGISSTPSIAANLCGEIGRGHVISASRKTVPVQVRPPAPATRSVTSVARASLIA